MAELIVLACATESGAAEVRDKVIELQRRELIKTDDAAVVIRKEDGKVKVKQSQSLAGAGALGGSFWGLLIGLIFFAPFLGMAVGALVGGIAGKATHVGVDEDFIKEVGNTITPGSSALFLLVREATTDKVVDELRPFGCKVLKTSLSKEDEARLKDTLGAEEVEV